MFGPPTNNYLDHRLVGMRLPTSLYNKAIPVVYGVQRIPWNLIWYGDFKQKQQSTSGKGGAVGGGKGETVYYAAIAAMLCHGPISGFGGVWDGQGYLLILMSTETYTVPGGGGTHTVAPPNGQFYGDLGAARVDAYSVGPFTDFGSPGATTLTGNQNTPLVPVTGTPSTGQYSLNASTGAYTFAAGDAGKTVYISYSWSVPDVAAGNKGAPGSTLNLTLFTGEQGQSPWTYLTSNHPGQALGYTLLAYAASPSLYLGPSGELPGFNFEVKGFLSFGGGIVDCNPRDILVDLLTNPIYGMGWPSSLLDLSGTWANYSDYCVANGIFLSLAMVSQEQASSVIARILKITNSELVWDGPLLKLITYGDTTAVGNGATFSPPTQPVVSLDDDDFQADSEPGEETTTDPITVEIPSIVDAYNDVFVEYFDRGDYYNAVPVEEKDSAAIAALGGIVRTMEQQSFHEITTLPVATKVATTILQRSVYIRATMKTTLDQRYRFLLPMDIIETPDDPIASFTPWRILEIEEDEKFNLAITAEEFPWGTSAPIEYPKQAQAGQGNNTAAVPGSINPPIIFELNNRISQQLGYGIGFAVCGANLANWGGCHVWLSLDGTTYKQISDIYGNDAVNNPARMGVLSANFPSGSDPDTVNTCSIDLTESGATIGTASTAQADADATLCLVDEELIAYSTATLTAASMYNLTTYIRRGQMTSAIAAHTTGAPFVVLDSNIFQWNYDATMIGKTLYFKFTSFNKSQNMEQSLADATAYTITPSGDFLGLLTPAHATYRPLSNPLVGHDAGSSATINITAFTMQVAGQQIAEDAGAITGLAYSTLYYVYFDDPNFFGGSVSYQVTTTKEVAIAVAGRFFVGSIFTPRAGAPDTQCNNDGGTGSQSGTLNTYYFASNSLPFTVPGAGSIQTGTTGAGSITNQALSNDGDPTTAATCSVGSSGGDSVHLVLSLPSGLQTRQGAATLYVAYEVTSFSGGSPGSITYGYQGVFSQVLASFTGMTGYAVASVALPANINLGSVYVELFLIGGNATTVKFFEAWLEVSG